MDNFLLDRFNLPMAAGVYFEYDDAIGGVFPPPGSLRRITEDGTLRDIENGDIRITEGS